MTVSQITRVAGLGHPGEQWREMARERGEAEDSDRRGKLQQWAYRTGNKHAKQELGTMNVHGVGMEVQSQENNYSARVE